jgi:hypothetical protein
VRNEEVLHRVKEERNIIRTVKRRKDNWIGHILCSSCLLEQTAKGKIEGGIQMMGRPGRRRKQLLDDLKEMKECWNLKEEALDCTVSRIHFGRGCGPVVRQTAVRLVKPVHSSRMLVPTFQSTRRHIQKCGNLSNKTQMKCFCITDLSVLCAATNAIQFVF